MKIIAITRTDGTVAVMRLLPNEIGEYADVAETIAKWAEVEPLGAPASYAEIAESDIPSDRTFRNAWELCGDKKVRPEIGKCRALWREKIRAARKPKLAALDVEHLRASETGDAARSAQVIAQKQALRDAPADPRIDAAATPEELKAVKPAGLEL